jgi:hypothetical protein
MRQRLHSFTRWLDLELDVRARMMVVLAAVLLTPVFFAPLWNLTMFAPQYPDGLRLDIWSYALAGGNGGQDLKEINLLNHYIGMRDLVADDFTEFHWLPFAIGALALFALRAAVLGRMRDLVDVTVLMTYVSAFSLWSFAHRLWEYGHTLAPEAAVKVAGFMPPLFGYQQIANFEVYSYPEMASYGIAAAMVLLVGAVAVGHRSAQRSVAGERASLAVPTPAMAHRS